MGDRGSLHLIVRANIHHIVPPTPAVYIDVL